MKLLLFILLGMLISYGLVLAFSNLGLALLGGGAFGLLLNIAISINKKNR